MIVSIMLQPEPILNIDLAARRSGAAKVMSTLQYITHRSAVRLETCHYDSDDSGELPDPFPDEDNNSELAMKRKVYAIRPLSAISETD